MHTKAMEFKDKLNSLMNLGFYLNDARIRNIIELYKLNYDAHKLKEDINKGVFTFIMETPMNVLDAILKYGDLIEKSNRLYSINRRSYKVQAIYVNDNQIGGELKTIELDLMDPEEAMVYSNICMSANKIFAINRFCDTLEKNKKKINVYEGDIIAVRDTWHRNKNGSLYMAFVDERYVSRPSYYKELIWTDKYGYFTPEGHVATDSNEVIKFSESLFNVDGNYNYHVITLCEDFRVLGNIATVSHLLKPDRKKGGKK